MLAVPLFPILSFSALLEIAPPLTAELLSKVLRLLLVPILTMLAVPPLALLEIAPPSLLAILPSKEPLISSMLALPVK